MENLGNHSRRPGALLLLVGYGSLHLRQGAWDLGYPSLGAAGLGDSGYGYEIFQN